MVHYTPHVTDLDKADFVKQGNRTKILSQTEML